jgi:hypothetical protein
MKKPFRNLIIWYLVIAMFVIGITPRVNAGFSPSEAIGLSQGRSSDLQKVQKFLELKTVRERLKEYGFAQDEIAARLDTLSDPQIHQLALKVDDLKVAADGGLGIVVGLLVIVILVVLLVMLLGHRIVVK